jgi:two-component system, NarL family, response regulator NreC
MNVGIRVLLADDHQIVRQGLKSMLVRHDIEVVGEASDGQEAVRLTVSLAPEVVVMDIGMPNLNGLDAAREILRAAPRTGVVLLTMHAEDHQVLGALRVGVRGYIIKTQAVDELVRAIQEVARGKFYLGSGASQTIVEAYLAGSEPPTDPLSSRDRQVLQLVAEGKTTKEIATLLGISPKTAETYRTRIMEKLNIHDTAGLVRYAIRRGLIEI